MPRKYSKWPILSHPSKYVRWRKWFGRKSSRRSRRKSNASWNCDLKKLVDPSGPIAWKKKSFGQSSVKSSSTRKRKWFQNAYKKLSHLWVKTLRDKNHTLTAVSLDDSRSCQFCPEKLDNSRSYQFFPEIWITHVPASFAPKSCITHVSAGFAPKKRTVLRILLPTTCQIKVALRFIMRA